MRIGNFSDSRKRSESTSQQSANDQNRAELIKFLVETGKMLVVYLVIFQILTQPITVLAQSKAVLVNPSPAQTAAKSNIKPKTQETDIDEGFLPNFEKRARKTFADAFGANLPLPQIFGENGKLQSLLAGGGSSADQNRELIESVFEKEKEANRTTADKTPTETVISLNAPVLTSGKIEGSLRVVKEIPFNLSNGFHLTGNLYAAGSPDISTANDSEIRRVINDHGDDLAGDYRLFLNGGRVDGDIYIHSAAENIFKDIPLGLPPPVGSQIVEINSAADLKNIKDWKAVKSLTVNAANLKISIPAGNYERITLNAPTELFFAAGNYSFIDTINFQKGSSLEIGGAATVGIGRNLSVEDVSIKLGENVAPEAVKINVLGTSVVLSGNSEIQGLLRAANANVVVNQNSQIKGQVIAGSLVMNGGFVTKYSSNGNAVFSPPVENNLAIVNDGMTLDGRIEGSVHQRTGQTTTLNSGASVTGDLLVPGLPQLVQNGSGTFGGVITGTGSATPTNYQIILNSNSLLRKLKNRINPITMPTVSAPPASTGTQSVVINNSSQYPTNFSNIRDITMNSNAGVMTLPPGNYRNISINSNSGIKLGVAGGTSPVTYNLSSLTVNSGSQIQIVGPVNLNLGSALNLNASAGVLQNPEWLKVKMSAGNLTLNSNSSLYGGVIAPNSTVTVNTGSSLVGNVVCKKLIVNAGGVLRNVLPNLLSDATLAITSPANNSTTTNASTAVSGTAQSSAGIANIYVNNQPATYNSSTNTWTIPSVGLTLGNNVITARAVDNWGTEVGAEINVTRQPPVTDTTPPMISISSPANNSTVQAQTITVSGTATDSGANASGLAGVTVNGQNATLTANGNWTISNVALNPGANTITARATDNAGNYSNATITVTREEPDATAPTLSIVAPADNSETTETAVTVSGTVMDLGANPSGVASVTVNGQTATVNGSGWTIGNIALTVGANTITANALDNAGNSTSRQITVTRIEPDTTAPVITITSPPDGFETNDTAISVSGTITDLGANASGVESVTVNGQNAGLNSGNWSVNNLALNTGSNTIAVRGRDVAGNEATVSITVVRREPDTQAPTVAVTSPADNYETANETITVSGTVSDAGANASGIQSVIVNGANATINGNNWTVENVALNVGSNTITATARDNSNNTSAASITVVRSPLDTVPPVLAVTSPADNSETFDSQITVSGTATDAGAGASGIQSITVNGILANYNAATNIWTATVSLVDGANTISVSALDNAPTPNQSTTSITVTKVVVQPPTLTVTNPQNGAFLSANSVTVAGSVASNKPDMTFTATVNGEAANVAGREFTKTHNLTDGMNVITVIATDALGQQAQQSLTLTNDRTPPTVFMTNVPQVVNPGESYTIGATAADAYGIAEVEFTVNGASVTRSSAQPYQFTLNIPLNQTPNQTLNISAIARDNAGLTATATARAVTSGPSGLTGYVFDDATGYVLPNANAALNNQNPLLTDENGLYSFVSNSATGNVLLTKQGYTSVERGYSTTAGAGIEIFDARLTPLDSRVNTADVNGAVNASDAANKIQITFAPNSFPGGTDVRVTPLSPQGLANLLPFGWSPIPDAVVDIRAANEIGFSNRNFANPASLTVLQTTGLTAETPVVLARYNAATHVWTVLNTNLSAGANGMLQANIPASGQYAFLVADTGITAPPTAVPGENLPSAAPASSAQLDSATATAVSSPSVALYSANAKARISFIADSASKLPSGVSIEASFADSYLTLIDRTFIAIDRPSQDFVLYSFPTVSTTEPNKLGAYFVAKPIRTDFGITDLLNAKVRVDIRSGRLAQTGVLIGQAGGVVRGAEGSELEIPGGAVNDSQVVFFNKLPAEQTGVILPAGYEMLGAFEVNLAGNTLTQSAKISMPSAAGDNSKIVAAKVISIAGQQGLKFVARVAENNSRLESSITQPAVPSGVNPVGIKDGGKYVFVRMPQAFGYVQGTVSSAVANTQAVKISNTNTPFVDLTVNNGGYTILGLANSENIQVDAISLINDATGFGTTALAAQDAVANLPISLASAVLSVQAVTPTNAATNVVVTTPVAVTFNKPIQSSTVTGSNIKLVTASGNPVITTLTVAAGGRSVILTPSANLQSGTDYRVQVSTAVRDIYGDALTNVFESTFRTANPVAVANQLQASQIRISYPNEQGYVTVSIPAGAVPSGSIIFAVNNTTGATVSTVAGSLGIELQLQARVGDEIELIIRQPDGTEYRVKQAAYRRADGFVSVGSNGGTITSEDGTLVLQVPAGAISGQADVKMTFAPESEITIPRIGEMAPGEMNYIGGVKIEVQGEFINDEELHLELPAPANVPEGQRVLIMKPARINTNGTEFDSWETITSAKVENGKIKSTSPPFIGITLVSTIVTGVLPLFYWIFVPARQRVVTGTVKKQETNGSYTPLKGAVCSVKTPNGENPRTYATSQPDGRFAISHNSTYYPPNQNIPVLCAYAGAPQEALAFPFTSTAQALLGFEVRLANVVYPATLSQQPQILIESEVWSPRPEPNPNGEIALDEAKTAILRNQGKFIMGNSILRVIYKLTPAVANTVNPTPQIIVNGVATSLSEFQCRNEVQTKICEKGVLIEQVGRYSLVVKARTVANDPATESTGVYNFISLANPNTKPSIPNANPFVEVGWTPGNGATQVDVGTNIHLEFSEPVKNLVAGTTVYLSEVGSTAKIGGIIRSGGIEVTSPQDFFSGIDFTPAQRLKGGKSYRITVSNAVVDTENRGLDQNEAESGAQNFTSDFRTFQGTVIYPPNSENPPTINDNSYKLAVLDDNVITAKAFFSGIGNGYLSIYDSSEFLGSPNAEDSRAVGGVFVPQIPTGLAASKERLLIDGAEREIALVAVSTTTLDTMRPRNVWFYDINAPERPRLIGVVTTVGNYNTGQLPGNLTIYNKRVYVGNPSNGGISVIDIEQALSEFKSVVGERLDTDDPNNEFANQAVIQAVSPNGGFGQTALKQRATYRSGNDAFQVYEVSTINQTFLSENSATITAPVTYATSNKTQLLNFNFSNSRDGLLGFSDSNSDGKDDRVLSDGTPVPQAIFADIKGVSQIQIQGAIRDLAVGVSSHLWVYNVTDPKNPAPYAAKSFAELGLPAGSIGRQVEIEDTLVYVMFEDRVAVFDISDPNNPYMTTMITGLSGLKRFVVKDGLIYTLGNDGLKVSIGRAVAQVITYGDDGTENICGNPVIIKRNTNEMAQPVGVYFQVYGRDVPTTKKIIIRKIETINGVRTEQEIGTATPEILSATPNGAIIGKGRWSGSGVEIDQSATYTAQIVFDENDSSEFKSKQYEIPFSYLIPEGAYRLQVRPNPNTRINGQIGEFQYLLAGNSKDVSLIIDPTSIVLRNAAGLEKDGNRSFGQNADYFKIEPKKPDGIYQYTFSATLNANPPYTEQVTGTIQIGTVNKDLRKPGSTVVNGVEINKGNLAVSENEVSIKGRGLSLDYTRSYDSQNSNDFGTLGYGWRHSYQISLVKEEAKVGETILNTTYKIVGGEGGNPQFIEFPTTTGEIKANSPYLGTLKRNADGSFDYFTKSRIKYHFDNVFDEERNFSRIYHGNLRYIEEPNGNRITLYYDSQGKLKSVVDSSNRSLNFEYEVAQNTFAGVNPGEFLQGMQGCPKTSQYKRITRQIQQSFSAKAYRISRVTGPGGLVIEYTYDVNGNLETATRSGADEISEPTTARQWKYGYYPPENDSYKKVHLLKTVKSPNNGESTVTDYSYYFSATSLPRVKDITMPEGVSNHFYYENEDNSDVIKLARFTDGNGYDTTYDLQDGRVKTITAPRGATKQLEWTDFGQIKRTTDPEGKTTTINFDANNNPERQTVSGGDKSIRTTTIFDAKFSKMKSFTDGNGYTTSYEINQTTGNVDKITLPTGKTVRFEYYPKGDLKKVTDQYGTITDFVNDAYGNPTTITKTFSGGAQTITQTFDVRSRQRSKADSLGTNETIDYDALDRPVRQIAEDPAGFRNTLTVEALYLPEGQPRSVKQKDNGSTINQTTNIYDKLQRLKQTNETVSGYQSFTRNFTYDNNSNLQTEQNRRGTTITKTYDELNHLTSITQGSKTVWEATDIDLVGNPKTVKDLYGNSTTYVYDGLQRLTEKRLPEGATEKLVYDDNNNITSSFDRNNKQTIYTYDTLNRIESLTNPLNRQTTWTYTDETHTVIKTNVSRGLTETVQMDGLERPLLRRVEFSGGSYTTAYAYTGRDVVITDPRGTATAQKMSGFGETGETTTAGSKVEMRYAALGGINSIKDPLNRTTTFTNDGLSRRTSASYDGGFSESWKYDGEGSMLEHTDRRGITSAMSYDDLGRKLTTSVGSVTAQRITYADASSTEDVFDARSNKTTYKYDGLRRVSEITNADGKIKTLTYDGENLRSESDFKGNPTRYIYDAMNRVTEVYDRSGGHLVINYSSNDLAKTTTDRRGNITYEEFDALGRILSSADGAGGIVSYTYDGNNNRLTQKDGNNNQTSFQYDALDRLTNITHAGGLQTETFTYDAAGNVKTHADGRGGVIEYAEYDTFNRAKSVKNGAGNETRLVYDGAGLLLSKRDPKNKTTAYQYNAFGSLTNVTEPGAGAWTLSYDDAQNLKSLTDALGRTTDYEYDNLNRLTKTKQPLGRETTYTYDDNSNVATITDPKGQTTTLTYTALDDVKTAAYANQITHSFDYDAEQNLWQIGESRNGQQRTSTREYDTRNRLKKTTDGFGKTVSFTYDAANNLKTLTDATGRVTGYDYDAKNQVDKVKVSGTQIADYDWFADGLLQKVSYANSTNRNYVYDTADRVTNITNNFGSGQSESFDYTYDANSNRISEIRKENGTTRRTSTYDYDELDRLTKADYTQNVADPPTPPLGQQASVTETTAQNTYGYDAVGNRTSERKSVQTKTITIANTTGGITRTEQTQTSPQQTTTATFNELNELTRLDAPNEVSNFTYDRNGNLSEISKNGGLISKYEYDPRNQLTKAFDGANNELARFDYDFERRRISKQSANGYESYAYAGSQIVNEFNATGAAIAKYAIGAGEIVKSEFGNGENNFHFTDALGSVTALTNGQGSLTTRNEYDAFGELATTGGTLNSIGYTGQRLDNETGLMALGNGERYYSPSYARFIQQDSFVGIIEVPQTLNRYSYVVNNPLKHTDPTGHIAPIIVIGIVAAVAGAGIGGAYSYEMQNAEIADGLRKPEDFSWGEVAKSAGIGAAAGILGTAAAAVAPAAIPVMIAGGFITSGSQIVKGHYESEAGYKNVGYVEQKYGVIGVLLSIMGARSAYKGSSQKLNGAPKVLEESPTAIKTQPKQLGDGGVQERINSGRLLNAAPDEVVNPPKQTRFAGQEEGAPKDLSTGRGNLNSVGKKGKIEVETTLDNVRVGVKETLQENLAQIKEIAPDAKVGYRGSLSRGFKHKEKGGGRFEPKDFDVDGFIVSDELAAQVKPVRGARWGNDFKPLRGIQKSIHQTLRSLFPGLRNAKKDQFQFRIFTKKQMQNWDEAKDPFTLIEGENE